MPRKKPVDLEAVRRAEQQLAAILEQYPELREPNHEREAALADWLSTLDTEEAPESLCFECGAPAEHRHHIVPRVRGGTYTVPLCTDCHSKVHGSPMTTAVLTSEAMAHKKANGEKLGGDCPYGFTVAADGKTLLPDSAEQRLIAQVRSARARGLSQRAVVAYLTEQGFTTRKGTAFSLIQVQRIMRQAQSSPPASHTHERTPMPYTPTGRPTGRPKTKEYDTLMARVPRDFAEQVKRYAARHRQSISELIRDGLVWRIEQDTPGRPWSTCIGMPIDPDDLSVPCNGDTGIQELSPRVYEAIAAAVREAIAPVMGIPITEHHESVIQQPVPVLQQDTVSRDGAEALASEGYDASKFSLGKLCPKGHRYGDSGLSLLRKHHGGCRECENQAKREKRARQKAAQAQER